MKEKLFWGEKGEYGPFSVQENGWPHAGEVIRHYRRRLHISAGELADSYGKAIGEHITARWIFKMEQQNKVPTDITRRRVLAKILGIPPLLLGLASLEQVTFNLAEEAVQQSTPATLKRLPSIDLDKYEQYARSQWMLSYTGEENLEEIVASIAVLEDLENQGSENLQTYVRSILNAYYQLASDIARHQGNFAVAWFYANNAVRVAKLRRVNDFIAAALYRRGYTNLEWGIFGDQVMHGVMRSEPDRKKIEAAINDFEQALPEARPQLKGAIWLELSRAQGILGRKSLALSLSNQAGNMVSTGSNITDPVEQILMEGALNGLNEGMYLLGKAASLISIGHTTTAIEVLDDMEDLKNGRGIARNQTRRLAYIDTLHAEASIGTKDFMTAATRSISALQTYIDIGTIERIAWIRSIYERLALKRSNNPEVNLLGKMLTEYYSRNK